MLQHFDKIESIKYCTNAFEYVQKKEIQKKEHKSSGTKLFHGSMIN